MAGRKDHNVVAWADVRDIPPHLSHDSGTFVAEDCWKRHWKLSVKEVEVTVAQSSRAHVDDHLVRLRRIEYHVLQENFPESSKSTAAFIRWFSTLSSHCLRRSASSSHRSERESVRCSPSTRLH